MKRNAVLCTDSDVPCVDNAWIGPGVKTDFARFRVSVCGSVLKL